MKIIFVFSTMLLSMGVIKAQVKPKIVKVIITSVKIGEQTWMNKNLNVSTYRNGDTIPNVTDASTWATLTTGAWCYYENNTKTGSTYGKLYNWYAVNDPRGLAPAGWHVPSDEEWMTLKTNLGGNEAGGKMKQTGTTLWRSPNTGANNTSGWSGLPGGTRHSNGEFHNISLNGFYLSTRDTDAADAWTLYYGTGNIYRRNYDTDKKNGFSVRCLMD